MIDARAVIDPAACIAADVEIGPWSVIGPEVEIGSGTRIGSRVVIQGPTKIGCNNQILQCTSIGAMPQNSFSKTKKKLQIGDNNIIREFCIIEHGETYIGNDNFFMACVQIGQNCTIGNHVTFINQIAIEDNVTIQDFVNISGFATIQTECTVGAYSFIGAGCNITQDVLPYLLIDGHQPKACGLNVIGLRRKGFTKEVINTLKQAYKIIFRSKLTASEVIASLSLLSTNCPQIIPMMAMLQNSTRSMVQ